MEDTESIIQIDRFSLSNEQVRIYNLILAKMESKAGPFHLFVSGQSGTGKTLLLKALQNAVRSKYGFDFCLSTAPTAMAAEFINANTINSTFLIAWQAAGQPYVFSATRINQLHAKLRKVKLLLIDVINYVSAEKFQEIDATMRTAFNNTKSFGGVSVIVFGDLFQLQPCDGQVIYADFGPGSLWNLFKIYELTVNQKMGNDEEKDILGLIRSSVPMENTVNYLRVCEMAKNGGSIGIVQTFNELKELNPGKNFAILARTQQLVGAINEEILGQCQRVKEFLADDVRDDLIERDDEFMRAGDYTTRHLTIAEGAPVIFTINLDGIVHGTCGTVSSYTEDSVTVRFGVRDMEVDRVGWFDGNHGWRQFPLRFAGAFNAHQVQGMSFDGVILNQNVEWSRDVQPMYPGQFYTALSRARSLKLCRITPIEPLTWRMPPRAEAEMTRLRENAQFLIDQ